MRLVLLTLLVGPLALASCGGSRGSGGDDPGGGLEGDADTDADADADTDADTDTDTEPGFDCSVGPETTGPWQEGTSLVHPILADGATATNVPYTHDAGLAAIVAAATGQPATVVDIPVTGAIVVAVGYVPENPSMNTIDLWLQDGNAAVTTFRMDIGMDPNLVKTGDAVSFTATEVVDYFGTIEITKATGFTIDSSGNAVFVNDGMTGAALDYATMGMQVVEIWGEIAGGPSDCGGVNCWEFDYGNGNVVTFRSTSDFIYLGDCVHFIGPLGLFSDAEQIQHTVYDWTRLY